MGVLYISSSAIPQFARTGRQKRKNVPRNKEIGRLYFLITDEYRPIINRDPMAVRATVFFFWTFLFQILIGRRFQAKLIFVWQNLGYILSRFSRQILFYIRP